MKGNNVAKYMNIVNRNSVHKNLKDELEKDNKFWIDEEFKEIDRSLLNDESICNLIESNLKIQIELEDW